MSNSVYYVMASNPYTPKTVLAKLSHAEQEDIRRQVASNIQTPSRVLEELSRDSNWEVRLSVGLNPITPLSIICRLCQDEDISVRLGMADCVDTQEDILEILHNDTNPYVACKAEETLRIKRFHTAKLKTH